MPHHASAERAVGMMVDAGVPSGVTASVAWRPNPRLRLHLGVGHNLLGPGARTGAALRFGRGTVLPTLSVEAGRFTRTDAAWLGTAVGASSQDASLHEVGYQYGAAHAGLEFAGADATFYVELGGAAIYSDLYFREVSSDGGVQMDVRTESSLDFRTLSGRAGVLVWF